MGDARSGGCVSLYSFGRIFGSFAVGIGVRLLVGQVFSGGWVPFGSLLISSSLMYYVVFPFLWANFFDPDRPDQYR